MITDGPTKVTIDWNVLPGTSAVMFWFLVFFLLWGDPDGYDMIHRYLFYVLEVK